MSRYHSNDLKALAEQQVRFAPQNVRRRQMTNAQNFLASVIPSECYDSAEIYKAITGYRPQTGHAVSGKHLLHDLRCLIEDLSSSLNLTPDDINERLWTVAEIAQRYSVSEKTVDRWRDRGLASLRVSVDRRKRVMITQSELDRFVAANKEEIEKSQRFRQLSDKEREQIIIAARELAASGFGLTAVSRKIARQFGRATETIRYTLRQYDLAHPETAVFPDNREPVSSEHQSFIFDLHRQGVPVAELARRFQRSKTAIHSILAQVRIDRLRSTPIEYMDSEEFREPNAQEIICGPAPDYDKQPANVRIPAGLPAYLAELYKVPLLNKAQEQHYFRKMNFLKFQAAQLQKAIAGKRPQLRTVRKVEALLEEANAIKNLLTRSNLRLVVSIAKRHLKPGVNFFELVSDGNMSLIRAIEKFDYARGNKFSTYASWAIMKNYARSVPAEHVRLDRFRTGYEEVFSESQDDRDNAFAAELANKAQRQAIMEILEELNGRERKVISHRFGLNQGSEPETLEEVGQRLGVTKERVRQIEVRTLQKMQRIAKRKRVDIPGI